MILLAYMRTTAMRTVLNNNKNNSNDEFMEERPLLKHFSAGLHSPCSRTRMMSWFAPGFGAVAKFGPRARVSGAQISDNTSLVSR